MCSETLIFRGKFEKFQILIFRKWEVVTAWAAAAACEVVLFVEIIYGERADSEPALADAVFDLVERAAARGIDLVRALGHA